MNSESVVKRYFSIKWQAFSLTSLVLACIFGGFLYFVSESTFRQFEIGRSHVYEQNKQQLDSLIEASGEKLIQIANTTAINADIISALIAHNQAALQDVLDELSWYLQVESGIQDIAVYDVNLALMSLVGIAPSSEFLSLVSQSESPQWLIRCEGSCLVFGGTPVLHDGEVIGFLMISEPLSNVMLRFQHLSNINTGLLANSDVKQQSQHSEFIPAWERSLVALTNPKDSKQVISSASEHYSLSELQDGVRLVDIDDQIFELRALPIENNQVVVISDVSQDVFSMERSKQESLKISVVSLIIAELILLLLLWRPMSRIKKTASILPLLAERKYGDARESFTHLDKKMLFRDETDILNVTALKLSSELEALQGQLETRAQQLELRGEELERERDFVSQLLDTVHAIIIIQDETGHIQLCNKFAVRLSGFSARELQSRSFAKLIEATSEVDKISECINDVIEGRLSEYQHEAVLNTHHGDRLHLAWRHAVLYNHESESRQVLSVAVDISARVKAERELAWLANHDTLSGLLNRRCFEDELSSAINESKRYGRSLGVMFIDLDDFKQINDRYGHHYGDQMIQAVSKVISNNTRKTDVSGRLGGDEFGMIIKSFDESEVDNISERIVNQIQGVELDLGAKTIRCSCSVGLAYISSSSPRFSSEDLINELMIGADEAMYRAKNSGKCAFEVIELDSSDV